MPVQEAATEMIPVTYDNARFASSVRLIRALLYIRQMILSTSAWTVLCLFHVSFKNRKKEGLGDCPPYNHAPDHVTSREVTYVWCMRV